MSITGYVCVGILVIALGWATRAQDVDLAAAPRSPSQQFTRTSSAKKTIMRAPANASHTPQKRPLRRAHPA
jgi:hypothetical protein